MSDLTDDEIEKEKQYWQARADEGGHYLLKKDLDNVIARPWWMKLRAAGSDTYRTPEGSDCKGEVMEWYAQDTALRTSGRRELMGVQFVPLAEVDQIMIEWLTTPTLDAGGSTWVADGHDKIWYDLDEDTEENECETSSSDTPMHFTERPSNIFGLAITINGDPHVPKEDEQQFNKAMSIVITTFSKVLVIQTRYQPLPVPAALHDFFSSSLHIFAARRADVVLAYLDDFDIRAEIRDAATAFEPSVSPFRQYMGNPAFDGDIPLLQARYNVKGEIALHYKVAALVREACLAALVVVRYPDRATIRTAQCDKFVGAKHLVKVLQMEQLVKPLVRIVDFDEDQSFTRNSWISSDRPPALVVYCNRFRTMPNAMSDEVIEVELIYDYYENDQKRCGERLPGIRTVMRGRIHRIEGRLAEIVFPAVMDRGEIGGGISYDPKADRATSHREPPSFGHVRERILEVRAVGPQLPNIEDIESHNYALDLMDAERSMCPDNSSFNAVVFPPLAQDGNVARTEIERALACSFYSTMENELEKPRVPSKLAAMQAKVFVEAFDPTYPAQVVSGPPGTGKSYLIASICKAYSEISSTQERWHDMCLVLTRTNAAAVDVAKELMDVACPFVIFKGGRQASFYQGEYYAAVEKYARDTKSIETPKDAWSTLRGKSVVICTLGKFEVIKDNLPWTPTLALVHGASEIPAPRLSQSLQGMRGLAKLILFGDEHQIPPYGQEWMPSNRSAFDYAAETSEAEDATVRCKHHTLDVSWRLPPALASYISTSIYRNLFSCCEETGDDGWKSCLRFLELTPPHTKEERKSASSSLYNPREARAVVQIVQKLVERQRKSWQILTFYSDQKREIESQLVRDLTLDVPADSIRSKDGVRTQNRHLTRTEASDLVSTVDAFQGKEADVIILSTVRTQMPQGYLHDIICDYRRLNVALTRCRDKLVVVTASELLKNLKDRHLALLLTRLASLAPRAEDSNDPFFS
ncbi:P-loop containing nucleoside triphosphate hydrolase protein [Acaromyces ingoldii]|uniref:P-loop containing nucleoside triphosphate hydrolase protein n=1 Tax=Acaromyces ingoldii TaxID=215250 RepID=A0A316YSV2_9BASI|nr:P-loop containing nucleoside triphosphate hydrolase protein [Acaromyces ingoldii]PWN91884.1 P-loop containing nucleoside triphosphate hydrolase protein [Acaromyces ingoldii]